MTKSDFLDWKRHPVTQQVFSQLRDRVLQIKEELVARVAYSPQLELAEQAGVAKGFQHLLDIDYEESSSD